MVRAVRAGPAGSSLRVQRTRGDFRTDIPEPVLHQDVARAVAGLFAAAGLPAAPPQAAFYVYPDFGPWREHLRAALAARDPLSLPPIAAALRRIGGILADLGP